MGTPNEEEQSEQAANERLFDKLEKAEKKQGRQRDEPEDSGDEDEDLELDDDGEDEEGEEEPRQTRREKRASRYADLRRELEETRRALNMVQQRFTEQPAPQQPPPQNEPDPEEELLAVQREQIALQRNYNARMAQLSSANQDMSDDETERFQREAAKLKMREGAVVAGHFARQNGYAPAPRQEHPVVAFTKAKYHQVANHPLANQQASIYYHRAVSEGRDGPEVLEEAYKAAHRDFFGEQRSKPTRSSQAKYTSSGSGPGPRSSESDAPRTPTVIRLSKEEKKMADAWGRNIADDKKRYVAYYKSVLSKVKSRKA